MLDVIGIRELIVVNIATDIYEYLILEFCRASTPHTNGTQETARCLQSVLSKLLSLRINRPFTADAGVLFFSFFV